MKMLFLFVLFQFLFCYSNTYSQDFEVKKTYDKFSKTTTIMIDERLIIKGSNSMWKLITYAGVIYNDKDTLYWWGIYKIRGKVTEIPTTNDKVTLMVDDSIIIIKPIKTKIDGDKNYYEFVFTKEGFLSIANGKIVDIQIVNPDFVYEGRFKDDDLKILRSFLNKY